MLAAAVIGYTIAKSPAIERLLAPYIVASQAIPIVAIAPLLVIWFGPGRLSKVLIASLIVFFPVLVNTVVGVRSVPEDLRQLMRSLRATDPGGVPPARGAASPRSQAASKPTPTLRQSWLSANPPRMRS